MTSPPRAPRGLARLAGAVAVGVSLAVAELVTGLSDGAQSLVASIGSEVIDRASGGIVKSAIEAFGTNDKAVLLTSIVVVSLGLGALVGGAAVRRPWVAPASFAAGGLVGALAGAADPTSSGGAALLAATLAAIAGWATLRLLLGVLTSGGPLPVTTTGARTRATAAPIGPASAEPMTAATQTSPTSPDGRPVTAERSSPGPGPPPPSRVSRHWAPDRGRDPRPPRSPGPRSRSHPSPFPRPRSGPPPRRRWRRSPSTDSPRSSRRTTPSTGSTRH